MQMRKFEDLKDKPEIIKRLNEVGNCLGGIVVRLPSIKEIDDARDVNLSAFALSKETRQYYLRNVLIAYEYSLTCVHRVSGNVLLDDIIDEVENGGAKIVLEDYDKVDSE